MSEGGQQTTGTRDTSFNLVSVLYHALEGASTYEQYVRDAEQAGDQELAAFFREVITSSRQVAEQAKQLLKQRLG